MQNYATLYTSLSLGKDGDGGGEVGDNTIE